MLLTQSAKAKFQSCRRAAKYRYEMGLVPQQEPAELRFGSLVHTGLEAHFKGIDPVAVLDMQSAEDAERIQAQAILAGYRAKYADEKFQVVSIEAGFEMPLSSEWDAGGKWDGLVRYQGRLWVLEHKTAARIDAAYLSRLWVDFQIAWYAAAAMHVHGEPVAGVIYDIIEKLPKADRAQRIGETDAEWDARLAAAKRPGACKRQMGETREAYVSRINAAYAGPERFHREEILLSADDLKQAVDEMVEIAYQWSDARTRNAWPRNTAACFHYGSACSYLPICQSRENPLLIANQYRVADPNRELLPTAEAEPEALAF